MTVAVADSSVFHRQFASWPRQAAGPAWLRQLRAQALARLDELGLPGKKDEEWRFTNITPIKETEFALADAPATEPERWQADVEGFLLDGLDCHLLVFLDGVYTPALSTPGDLPAGVELQSLAAAVEGAGDAVQPALGRLANGATNPFTVLNTAFADDGALVRIAAGATPAKPLHLLYLGTPQASATVFHPRNLIAIGAGARATLIESYAGAPSACYLSNSVTEIEVAAGAALDHYLLQEDSPAAYHIGAAYVRQADASEYRQHAVTLGGRIGRQDTLVVLDGEDCECSLNGFYLGHERQTLDHHTVIDHARPDCRSSEVYKGILQGRAAGVFKGKIVVRPDAQRTDAKQTSRALLLSDEATVNAQPQLEIFADDVKCSHGATVGQLDANALFYLRARGIDADTARGLLTYAFAAEALAGVAIAQVRRRVDHVLRSRFGAAIDEGNLDELDLDN